jgi:hypothetical protein
MLAEVLQQFDVLDVFAVAGACAFTYVGYSYAVYKQNQQLTELLNMSGDIWDNIVILLKTTRGGREILQGIVDGVGTSMGVKPVTGELSGTMMR